MNDLFLHIDSKSKVKPEDFHADKSRLFAIPRIEVNWGAYSQIECTQNLLEAATSNDRYMYYHLVTGSSYPIKSQKEIQSLFAANRGSEMIECEGDI